jgi:hypothetical protein
MVRNADAPFTPDTKDALLNSLKQTLVVCSDVNLPVTLLGIEWAQKQIEAEGVTVRRVGEVFRELTRRIQDELSSLRFLYVPPDRALYYQQRIKGDIDKPKHILLSETAKKKFAQSIGDAEKPRIVSRWVATPHPCFT